MPGAYFTQGAVQNAVRERPTDEQLAFNRGAPIRPLAPENIEAIRSYIDSLGETQDWTAEHEKYLANQIRSGQVNWLKKDNKPAMWAKVSPSLIRGSEAAGRVVQYVAGKAGAKALKGAAYNMAGKEGLSAAKGLIRFGAEGMTLPVAVAAEVGIAGINEAGDVMSRPNVEQVQANIPEALFHKSRDPLDLSKWKDWTHVGGKVLHALNPFEGRYRLNQAVDAIKENPNAQIDFDSLNEYMLSGGLPHGFGPNNPEYGYHPDKDGKPEADEMTSRLGQLRAERYAYLHQAAQDPSKIAEYAAYNAILNQRFLAAKAAQDERKREEQKNRVLFLSVHPKGNF